MNGFRLWGPVLALAFLTTLTHAQSAPLCDVTCRPDPTASSYAAAAAARPRMLNARGSSSSLVARTAIVRLNGGLKIATVPGSQSYNDTFPILRLGGRAGMDLVLKLHYNSRVWSVDTVNGTATFNIDRDFPSYGFRLDFGYVENVGGEFIVTESDGTKHLLTSAGFPKYDATDASYMEYNSQTNILVYRNGMTVQYQAFPSDGSLFRPVWIKDANGNYISIAYVSGHDQMLYQVSDTLGRVITFNYDSSNHLSSLSQLIHPSGTQTYVSFQWGTAPLNYAFTSPLTVINSPASGTKINVLTGCTYPNGTGYRFTYGDWGIINKIENLSASSPQATRSYVSYNYPLASAGALTDAPFYTQQTISPDGTTASASVWNYAVTKNGTGVVTSMAVKDPNGNVSTTNLDPTTGLLTSASRTDSNNNTLQTLTYAWTTSGAGTVPQSIQTTNDAGQNPKIQYAYDSNGNATTVSEYDFDGTLKRVTARTYSSAYASQHILNLPTMIEVEDGSSNVVTRTDLAYDTTTLTSVTGVADHDDQSYGSNFTARGNLTSITRYANASAASGAVTRTFNFDTLGNVISAQLDCCNQKTFNFSSTTGYSAPDSIVRGPSGGPQFTTSFTYNPDNNLLLTSTDENDQETQYQYDSMGRTTQVTPPPQGSSNTEVEINTAYDDVDVSPAVTRSNTANSAVTVTTLDGLGHILRVDKENGSTVVSSVKYGYDQIWQWVSASNPFAPSDTPVNTTFSYDGLGRLVQATPPSAGDTQYQYSGNTVTVTDPAGKQRKSIVDALGRLIEVDEPVPGTRQNAGSGSANVSGTEQSAQVLKTAATSGSGSVSLSGSVQWDTVSSASTGGTTNITIGGTEQQRPAGVVAGTGSVSLSGSEQVIAAVSATASVTLSGSLQSKQVQSQAATHATGSVTISGQEQSAETTPPPCESDQTECQSGQIVYDTGGVTIAVNGHSDTYGYGQNDTTNTIASGLATAINGDSGASATASASGATVYLTAKSSGSGGNLSLASSSSNNPYLDFYNNNTNLFPSPSFTTSNSGSSLTGGQNAVMTTVYDSGGTSITVNGREDGVSWSGSGTTAANIASGLVSAINNDSSAMVRASASGGTVSLTAKTGGTGGNVSLSCSSSHDSGNFSNASFAISCPSAVSGGKNAIYDSGTASITVSGHTNAVSLNSSSTPTNIASALVSNINADTGASVTAKVSGTAVDLTATTKGTISNYPLSAAVSYDSTDFSKSSFAAATSGANLTGGSPNNNAVDSGTMTVKVNSNSYTVNWGSSASPGSIANALVSALGSDPAVTPTLSGSTVYLDPKQPGTAYSFSTAYTYDSADFTQSSFHPTNSISDYGTTSATVSGHADSVPWAGHSTTASIVTALANQINSDSAAVVNASVSGSQVTLTAKTTGAGTNYALASADSFDSTHFTSASFGNSNSGTALSGGADAVYNTVYDAGTVWIEVNGFQASTTYQQGSTPASIASALASQFNGSGSPVSASASGSTLTLTATQDGSATDYSLSSGATTSQSANFSEPSFSAGISGDTLAGGSNSASTWQATTYSYDVLNDLTQVSQGSQTRSYTFDSLGRQTASTTPESGTVNTYYTDSNNNACAGDPTVACRVTDARGITKSLSYDGINRITGVSYSDGTTPSVTYKYDTATLGLDRIASITEGSNSHSFTYDNLGRITADSQIIGGTTYSLQYDYNLAGQLNSITYPTGRVVTQNYDAIGRTTSIADGATTYLSGLSYNAAGETTGLTLGNSVQGTMGYNDHLQLASLRYFTPGAASDVLNLGYDYGSGNDGQIASVRYFTAPGEQNEDTTKSEYFSYDQLGRLVSAHTGQVSAASTPTPTWALSWNYDRWGNRLSQTLAGGSASVSQPNLTVDPSTNRITNSGYAYDAAGNMTNDGANAYVYDGANRLTQINAGPPTYTYFGPMRIKKVTGSNTTVYIYSGSRPIVEYVNGSLSKEYIYAGSRLLATIAGGSINYHHPDHLSNRAETDANGNITRTLGHFPFGDPWYETGAADKWKFTSYERDSDSGETGLDYAQFRHYSSALARFVSPDPLAGLRRIPQSLNRYAYVLNDPINRIDPAGMDDEDDPLLDDDCATTFFGCNDPVDDGVGGVGFDDLPDAPTPQPDCCTEVPDVSVSFTFDPLPAADSTDLSSFTPPGESGSSSATSSDAFEPGSLAYAVFQGSAPTWEAAAGTVNDAFWVELGGFGGAAVGAAAPALWAASVDAYYSAGAWYTLTALGGGGATGGFAFYSGPGALSAAEAWAAENGGVTIRQTEFGAAIDAGTMTQAQASAAYANSVYGEVHVFSTDPFWNYQNIWFNTEWPTLLNNPNVTNFVFHTGPF